MRAQVGRGRGENRAFEVAMEVRMMGIELFQRIAIIRVKPGGP